MSALEAKHFHNDNEIKRAIREILYMRWIDGKD